MPKKQKKHRICMRKQLDFLRETIPWPSRRNPFISSSLLGTHSVRAHEGCARDMARHHPRMVVRIFIGVLIIASVTVPTTAAYSPRSRGGRRDLRESASEFEEGSSVTSVVTRDELNTSALDGVPPSAGDKDDYSPLAAFDSDAPAEADRVSDEPQSNPTLLVVFANENGGENTTTSGNATSPALAPVEAPAYDDDSTAFVVSTADPVRRVKAKAKTAVVDANETATNMTEAEVPSAETDYADAPRPSPEFSLDEETLAEAPEQAQSNITANVSAPAPAPDVAPGPETSAEAPEASAMETNATNYTNATEASDAVSDEDETDVVVDETEKKSKKEKLADVEEEDSITSPATEEEEEDTALVVAPALPGTSSPEPEDAEFQSPEAAPPPPLSGTVSSYLPEDGNKGTRAGRAEDESEDDVFPSRWEAATGATNSKNNDPVAVEFAVHPEGGESQFERNLPVVLGGCILAVVGIVVYNRMRVKRAAKSGKGKRAGAAKAADWNQEGWSDEEGWSDSSSARGKHRGLPISAEKWAAEEPAWSDDEDTARDDDGWR